VVDFLAILDMATESYYLTRRNKILTARDTDMERNLLVLDGGRPYIEARLCRAPHEDSISWSGDAALGIYPRKDRAFMINRAARIANTLNQYVFGQEIARAGISEDFEKNATKTGLSINQAMERASLFLTAGRWCWIGVDRAAPPKDETGTPRAQTAAEKAARNDRPYITIWNPRDVVDWAFDLETGALLWLMTEVVSENSTSWESEPIESTIRTVWTPTEAIAITIKDGKEESRQVLPHSAGRVPFFLLGEISDGAWWFDNIEQIQAACLNLESANHENNINAGYPQLVLPAGVVEEIASKMKISAAGAMDLVRGLNFAVVEGTEDNGITRYIMPDAGSMQTLPENLKRLGAEMYNAVGLGMQQETRQVASAEAKAWDHLDISVMLSQRAQRLEEAETWVVDTAQRLDATFQEYEPQYPRDFDISEFETTIKTITEMQLLGGPQSFKNELLLQAVELLDDKFGIPEERKQQIIEEIQNMTEIVPELIPAG